MTDATSRIALAAGREIMFGAAMDMCDWGASHLRSAAGAAWRGDQAMVGVHLRDARSALVAALKTYIGLAAEDAKPRVA